MQSQSDANPALVSIPAHYSGWNLNTIFAYSTSKYVKIEDRRLGILYYFLVFLILVWIVVFQFFYGNEHYKMFDVHGITRISVQQPTKGICNPRENGCENTLPAMSDLPYCKEYNGAAKSTVLQNECVFVDMIELHPYGAQTDALFVPTRIDKVMQKNECFPGKDNKYSCKRFWSTSEDHKNTYVAGIEDYTVLLYSSYSRRGIQGISQNQQGFYYECIDPSTKKTIRTYPCHGDLIIQPIECLAGQNCRFDIKTQEAPPMVATSVLQNQSNELPVKKKLSLRAQRGRDASAVIELADSSIQHSNVTETRPPDVYGIPDGDVFRLGKLIELAGLDLDQKVGKSGSDEPLRQIGTAISVQVEYSNLRPWHSTLFNDLRVGYIYRVVAHEIENVKAEVYAAAQPEDANVRAVQNRHGILLHAKVTGSFGELNVIYLLVILSTSFALLGTARSLVDILATTLPLQHQNIYKQAKYEQCTVEE